VPPDENSGLHFCFAAPSRGYRSDDGPGYYAAFVIDPDGYRIEADQDG
jgi:hypothetical protein